MCVHVCVSLFFIQVSTCVCLLIFLLKCVPVCVCLYFVHVCTCVCFLIGERAKRARHSHVCSIENRGYIYYYYYILWYVQILILITRKEGGA